jgi:mannose-6-phosphate isomerase
MGTHPSGHSKVISEGGEEPILLKEFLKKEGLEDIPFLFKVLSVETALSIQAHPDKQLAETLFEKFPDVYKDSNHKPEMAIALTDFEALCGFKSQENMIEALS